MQVFAFSTPILQIWSLTKIIVIITRVKDYFAANPKGLHHTFTKTLKLLSDGMVCYLHLSIILSKTRAILTTYMFHLSFCCYLIYSYEIL